MSARTSHLLGIGLHCRRDFAANAVWPKLGFVVQNERSGRAVDGSTLSYWWFDHCHPDLFGCPDVNAEELTVALDTSIVLDLIDSNQLRCEESVGLLADWLRPHVRLLVTGEVLNDLDGQADGRIRRQRKRDVQAFEIVRTPPDAYRVAEQRVRGLFPTALSDHDASDMRHVARATALGADALATRDDGLLGRAEAVYRAVGLSILRPAEVIGRIDELTREHEYQRHQLAGTNEVQWRRVAQADDRLLRSIQRAGERKKDVRRLLAAYFADPLRFECIALQEKDETTVAFFVRERTDAACRIPVFRMAVRERRAAMVVRTALNALTRQAATAGCQHVLISDCGLDGPVLRACADRGYFAIAAGQLKVSPKGILTASEAEALVARIRADLGENDPALDQIERTLRTPGLGRDATLVSELDHALWPALLAETEVSCYVIPIKAKYAYRLFDEELAKQSLFGADVDLALNPESVYYRAARPGGVVAPARVLWYVSGDAKFEGAGCLRAAGRIVEVHVGLPLALHKRFRRLGVFSEEDVLATAKGDPARPIMAIRFDDTTPLPNRIPWDKARNVLREHGIHTQFQSPTRVTAAAFRELFDLGMGGATSSAVFDPAEVR